MTEEEAKTKWCPFVRVEGDYVSRNPVNRSAEGKPSVRYLCVASGCMGWRTRPMRTHVETVTKSGKVLAPALDEVRLDGFCGLAGAPQ